MHKKPDQEFHPVNARRRMVVATAAALALPLSSGAWGQAAKALSAS